MDQLNQIHLPDGVTYLNLVADERHCLHHLDAFFQHGLIRHPRSDGRWWLSTILKTIGATTLWHVSGDGTVRLEGANPGCDPDPTFLARFADASDRPEWFEGHPELEGSILRIPLGNGAGDSFLLVTGLLEGSVLDGCSDTFLLELATRLRFAEFVMRSVASLEPDTGTRHLKALEATLKETRRQLSDSRTSGKFSALRRLAGGIAHEFNNQVGIILGFIDYARNREDAETTGQALDMTARSCRRMHEIVARLLSFSDRHQLQPVRTDLNDLVRQEAADAERRFTERGVRLMLELDDLPEAWLDRRSFQAAVREVLVNALHASASGQAVRVLTRHRNERVEFLVADRGEGLDQDELDRICEPFYTSKGALGSGQEDGTGLGLATTRSTVLLHNGQMILHSRPGAGTLVGFSIPRKDTVVDDGPLTESQTRILVVDRNQDLLDRAAILLSARDYDVETCRDGLGALNNIGTRLPHVMLVGEQLADMGGLELKASIESFVGNVPTLLCTERLSSELVRRSTRAGVTHFLEWRHLDDDLDDEIRHALSEINIHIRRDDEEPAAPGVLDILVVDDEPNMGELMRRLLEPRGHHVTVLRSPTEALERDLKGIDLAFIDLIMPELDGQELTRRLRAGGFEGAISWMTGFAQSDVDRVVLADLEVDSVLEKPLHMSRILGVVEDVGARIATRDAITEVALPDGSRLLSIDRPLDRGTLTAFRRWISTKRTPSPLIVDLTACGFLDTTALSAVITLDLVQRRDGQDIQLIVSEGQRGQIGTTRGPYRLPSLCESLKEARSRLAR